MTEVCVCVCVCVMMAYGMQELWLVCCDEKANKYVNEMKLLSFPFHSIVTDLPESCEGNECNG